MGSAAHYPYEDVLTSLAAHNAPSQHDKVNELRARANEKKIEIDYKFRHDASVLFETTRDKLEHGWFYSEKSKRNLAYRTESKIRKRYWAAEWKKEKLDWDTERHEARLRGERIAWPFSMREEKTGLTLSELKRHWRERRAEDLDELQSDYDEGRPVVAKWYPDNPRAAKPSSVAPVAAPVPLNDHVPVVAETEPQPIPSEVQPRPNREMSTDVPPSAPVVEPAPMRIDNTPEPVSAREAQREQKPLAIKSDTVFDDVQKSIAQLQESLDRALQALNTTKSKIAEERIELIEKRAEIAKGEAHLKEKTEALERERTAFDEDLAAFGKKTSSRDQKKAAFGGVEATLTAEQKEFEKQVELWEAQQRQINQKLKEFRANADEVSRLRADVDFERTDIERQKEVLTKKLAGADENKGALDKDRRDLRERNAALDEEIADIDKEMDRVMTQRDGVVQQRMDFAARQKQFVDNSLKEWGKLSGESPDQIRDSKSPPQAEQDKSQTRTIEVSTPETGENSRDVVERNAARESHDDRPLETALVQKHEEPTDSISKISDVKAPTIGAAKVEATVVAESVTPGPRNEKAVEEQVPDQTSVANIYEREATEEKPIESSSSAVLIEPAPETDAKTFETEAQKDRAEQPIEKAIEGAASIKETFSGLKNRLLKSALSVKDAITGKEEPKDAGGDAQNVGGLSENSFTPRDSQQPASEGREKSNASYEEEMVSQAPSGLGQASNIRDILYETKENVKGQAVEKFQGQPRRPGGVGAAVKQELLQSRSRRNELKVKKQEVARELERLKCVAAQDIAELLKTKNEKSLLKNDEAIVAKLVERLVDNRSGREIVDQYIRARKEADQADGSKIILEGMRVTIQNMGISMSNAGGRMRHAAVKAKGVGLTCTEGVGRLMSASARNRLVMQRQKMHEERHEPK